MFEVFSNESKTMHFNDSNYNYSFLSIELNNIMILINFQTRINVEFV